MIARILDWINPGRPHGRHRADDRPDDPPEPRSAVGRAPVPKPRTWADPHELHPDWPLRVPNYLNKDQP